MAAMLLGVQGEGLPSMCESPLSRATPGGLSGGLPLPLWPPALPCRSQAPGVGCGTSLREGS